MTSATDLKANGPSTVIVVHNDGIGSVEEALRHKLIGLYLKMLLENDFVPGAICFYASGVKLVT